MRNKLRPKHFLAGILLIALAELSALPSNAQQQVVVLGDDGYAPFS